MKLTFSLLLFISLTFSAKAQNSNRPKIWGIAKMTSLVSDFQMARDYYGKFLGFDEAFSYSSEFGKVISFKVNDRQFLEFIEDKNAKEKSRLVSVSFETEDVEQMREYLQGKGIQVPEKISIDEAGNKVILIHSPAGIPIEFISYGTNSLHRKSIGKFLSENRISKRIHHVGVYCNEMMDNDPFYSGMLGFREQWRFPEDHQQKVQVNYLHIPDCTENIELYASKDVNAFHPCLLVESMQETIYALKERGCTSLTQPYIGKGRRWLLNLENPDGTKIEFTEAFVVK